MTRFSEEGVTFPLGPGLCSGTASPTGGGRYARVSPLPAPSVLPVLGSLRAA
jgi:hypothetical protein